MRGLWIIAIAAAAATVGLGLLWASGGVYTQTKHGDTATGVERLATEPVGDCAQCHDQHASRDGTPTGGPYPYVLFAPNDNQLCSTAGGAGGCHSTSGALGIYPGPTEYDQSSHQTSSSMVWPGPDPRARPAGEAGFCVNCHTPHGAGDGLGLIPSQISVREEGSCLACHDASGPALTDVQSDFNRSSAHPTTTSQQRHDAGESTPGDFGISDRHAECEDCHNPHDVRADTIAPTPPDASARNQRISRVAVTNGTAGTVPTYTFLPAADTGTVREYELCFKCHSSWTTQPAGQDDMALLFNPNNPSYHPVEALGKNTNIRVEAFVSPWTATSRVYCGDCHGSDDGAVAGPHGSTHAGLLRDAYPASSAFREMAPNEVCFNCHSYTIYADRDRDDASRFRSHERHFDKDVVCYACHDSHGSTTLPSMIVTGRDPGIVSYTQDANGGSCAGTPACHGTKTYTINYPR